MLSIIFAECHKLFMLSVVTPKNLIIRHLHRGLISWSFSTLKAPSAWIKSYKTFFGQYMPWRLHWKSIIGSDSGWTLTSEAGATLVLNRPYSQTYGKAINCQTYLSGASGTRINIFFKLIPGHQELDIQSVRQRSAHHNAKVRRRLVL